jgi:hypothetical protein
MIKNKEIDNLYIIIKNMKRRSSIGKRRSTTSSVTPTKPAAPPAVPSQQAAGPGLVGSMVGGMAMGAGVGIGSEVAHQAIGSVMGNNNDIPAPPQPLVCNLEHLKFRECLEQYGNPNGNLENPGPCGEYAEMLKSCFEANKK